MTEIYLEVLYIQVVQSDTNSLIRLSGPMTEREK